MTPSTSRPQAVLFDAGSTLIHADGEVLRAALQQVGVNVEALTDMDFIRALVLSAEMRHLALPADLTDTEKVAHSILSLLRIAQPRAMAACVAGLNHPDLYRVLDPDAIGMLTRLRDDGLRLGVVSNSAGTLRDDLAAFDLLDFFEVVIDSTVIGAEKPQPAPFVAALRGLNLPADACWYVGDGLRNDVLGALAAGYANAVIVDRFGDFGHLPGIDLIRRLAALPHLIDGL